MSAAEAVPDPVVLHADQAQRLQDLTTVLLDLTQEKQNLLLRHLPGLPFRNALEFTAYLVDEQASCMYVPAYQT